jgi:hypothetical protein
VWAETRNHTRTRLAHGWQQPLVTIHPPRDKFDPNNRLKLSCTDPFIPPAPDLPSPPRVSYVWTLLDHESRALPELAAVTLGADVCGIELPEKSLDHGRRYAFQLDAFLPNGMSSRSGWALSPPLTCLSRILRLAPRPRSCPKPQTCQQRPLAPPSS